MTRYERSALLNVGCARDLPLARLQAFIGALYADDPTLEVAVAFLPAPEQLARLRDGELELAIVDGAGRLGGLENEPLFAGERLVALLPTGHRGAERDTLSPDELRGEELLVPRGTSSPSDDELMTRIHSAGYRFREVRETLADDPRSLLFAVASNHSITFGPASALDVAGDVATLLVARPTEPPIWMPDTHLVWRADLPAHLRTVLAAAREVARKLSRESLRHRDEGA